MTDPAGDAPSLSVSGGPLDGRSVTLDHSMEVVLGSGPNTHFRLEAGNLDAEHAHVIWDERGVVLSDSGSSTGTYVNGERIGAEQVLKDGDRIFLGPPGSKASVKLLVHIPESAAAPVTAPPLVLEPTREPQLIESADEPLVIEDEPQAAGTSPVIILDQPPAPQPLSAKPAPAASAPPPPSTPAEARKPPRPEYTNEMPSIAPLDRVREPLSFPPPAPAPRPKAAPPRKRGLAIPRPVLLGGLAALVTTGGFLGYRSLQKPPPVLTSIAPPKAEPGQTVTISGTGFEADPAKNLVRIGDQAGKVISASETQLAVTLPELKVAGGTTDVQLSVEARRAKSNPLFLKVYAPPKVAALEPDVAMPGDVVVAKGQNLWGPGAAVLVGNQPAETVETNPAAVAFRVPALPPGSGKSLPVTIRVGPDTGKPATLLVGRLPLVIETSPMRGMAGERVAIRGRGFEADPAANAVSFGAVPALVLAASATELTVSAPAAGAEPQVTLPVTVNVRGKASAADAVFSLTRPPSSVYVPRYFPAPVPDHPGHDHVFVSTELGPALVLTGKGDAPSTAERAERVAAALNTLVEQAVAGRSVAFEVRDKPAPAVAAAGSDKVLATATAADAAGYAESWDPAAKGGRPSPPQVAAYWAAILQDHLGLFVQRQRPVRVLELSPRGKVLVDLHAEAARRSGGGGVPLSAVSPLPPSMARAFREMALLLPGEAQPARAAAAVEGRWTGTLVEGDAGERAVELRLRFDGGRLGGSLTTRSRALSMDIPLREASYEKGTLRFSLVVGGAPKHFVGILAGDAITGTIHASPGAKEAVGRFSLKFVQ